MKKYGTAEYIIALVQHFIDSKANALTEAEKNQMLIRCENAVNGEYPSARDMEVA